MLLEFKTNTVVVRSEVTDPRFGRDESWFLHRLKVALRNKGYDAIKKRAWKDGNLVDDNMHYVRDRKDAWRIYDGMHALRNCAETFTDHGEVTLNIQGVLK